MKVRFSFFFLLLAMFSCSSDYKDTITAITIPTNEFDKIYNYDTNTLDIDLISFVLKTGDLNGITLYGSNNEDDLKAVPDDDINDYFPDINTKKFLISINDPTNINYLSQNRQLTTIKDVQIPADSVFFLTSTALFKNSIMAAINENQGYFESSLSNIIKIYPKKKKNLKISNFTNMPASGALEYDTTAKEVSLSATGGIQLKIVILTIGTESKAIAFFSSTDPNNYKIALGGLLKTEEQDLYTDMSNILWADKANVMMNNIYYVKYKDDYFKIYISSSDDISSIINANDAFNISVNVHYSPVLNADRL